MTDKELRKLKRAELLEMLLARSEENEELKAENEKLRQQLAERKIVIDNAGSIAEAALQMSGIFETAQKAADDYLRNVRELSERKASSPD